MRPLRIDRRWPAYLLSFVCAVAGARAADKKESVGRLRAGALRANTMETMGQAAARSADLRGRHIVQFRQALTKEHSQHLRALGVELEDYIPEHAYIANLHGANLRALARLEYSPAITPIRRQWKIDPALAASALQVTVRPRFAHARAR